MEKTMEESTPPTSAANVVDTAQRPQGNARSNSENSNFRTSGSNSSGSSGYGGKLPSTSQKDNNRTSEDNATTTSMTNAVDSAYSQSNSRSLSSESSQCRMRGSNSSGSSGYGGKPTASLSPAQAENSASSGNSGELTTVKNLKRSKNKGRKKKAKTKQSQSRPTKVAEPIQEVQESSLPTTLEQTSALPTDLKNAEDSTTIADDKNLANKQTTAENDILQKEAALAKENKPNHDLNDAIPMSTNEPLKEKIDQNLEEENSSATDKSPDDLEVDNILSNSKSDQQNTEHRTIQESFCCAVSMHDGVILSTTANLTESLGFPKDVWLGRAFIDFVHPKDRPTFASQITNGYMDHISLKEGYLRQNTFEKTPLYVLLRCYRGFDACGFAVKNRPVSYKPFKLIFRKAPDMSNATTADGNSALRIICAIALSSIYKVPDEAMKKQNAKFSTRHTAAGILVHIDGIAVTAIGYMPQDTLGKSIFDFFHPEDMILMKTAYEMLMKNTQVADGRVSTPPYRFLVKNGCYITLETEWTRVFNPWSRKLEFVSGDHCVLRGPNHCDIFEKTGKYACKFPTEILEKAATLKKELLRILSEPVPYPTDSVKQQVSKRCQALASFMESLLAGVQQQELKLDLLSECEPAASEHGSVMLGEISPHHLSNHDESKSSSETPPTYNQLNYFENLNRFFNSVQPIFVPNEFKSLPYQIDHVPTNEKDRMLSPIQQCGEESGGSFNSSSDSPQFESTNTSNTSNNGHTTQPHLLLTEATVCRHTDDMEMQMVKNHKKYRTRSSHMADKKKAPDKGHGNQAGRNQPVKRSWPNEMGNELSKNSKTNNQTEHNRYPANANENAQNNESSAAQNDAKVNEDSEPPVNHAIGPIGKVQAVHLWPPFSVNASPMQNNTIPTNTTPNPFNQFILTNHLTVPRYYMPPANPNGILKMDTKICEPPPLPMPNNVNVLPSAVVPNLPNPYALQYLKNLMVQPRPFMGANLTYPYPPIAYQPLPMLPQKPIVTTQVSGPSIAAAANANAISVEMPSNSQQATPRSVPIESLPNMESIHVAYSKKRAQLESALYENTDNSKPVNLSTNPDKTIPKLQVKPWANMKDENSEEIDASNSSFSSSFFDSQLRTDDSWESDKTSKDDTMGSAERSKEPSCGPVAQDSKKRGKVPYWMKNVQSTPDLVLRYQVRTKEIEEALISDLRVLKEINQPGMVNDQLTQLYLELDMESQGQIARISLGDTPSNSSEDEENMSKKKKNTHYSKLSMIYEENAPVQPPS